SDISADALAVAAANAERSGLSDRFEPRHGSLWEIVGGDERFDVIVSNPPYVAESDRAGLEPEVGEHEPPEALFGGREGLDVLRALVEGASGHLAPGGLLATEVGLGQSRIVADWLASSPEFEAPRVMMDLTGRERIVLAERVGSERQEGEKR
ncbi:MAG TPA: hypothetical protein VK966_08030, partial [Longimicrobiales bacterium]|nr:hypothetical protein [Longimicrobiales bacterium]